MDALQRKTELKRIQDTTNPCMTGITLTYHGERTTFNAYRIPLNFLTYNPYNGRIGSVVKSYERQNHTLDTENPQDIALIEKFLWDSKVDANKRTLKSLLEDHQQRYGIVTADGKIIDGNRRASLLNRIWRDDSIAPNLKQHTQYFEAIILPIDADRKEILRLETTYQMGEDAKVDYGPIEKYLKARDLADEGFSNNDIASFMGVKPTEVRDYLNILKIMDDYLDTYGYTGIYTMLETREDSFIKLEAALRSYTSGGVAQMWGYDVEADVSDLKSIAFDYIRMGLDQQDFRDIIRKPVRSSADTSFFANEKIWEKFSNEHFEVIENIEEQSVEELIKNNPSGDISRLLRARDSSWRNKVKDRLNDNFQHAKDALINRKQSTEPLKLLQKAWEAISAIDTNQQSFKENDSVKEYVNLIMNKVTNYQNILD